MKAVIDTCIIIDALQKREPFCNAAMDIFMAVSNRRFIGILTAKSITDIHYILHRSLHDENATRKAVRTLFTLFSVADTLASDCQNSLSSPINDYEDAVMSETAYRLDADYMITRNKKDYVKASVPVLSPDEFRKLLENEQ
ncbi:MAG: PIN domain-containing protein [Oscillospiraceae bacterium]|nr:PIN domain-containing protein [Oscillospiraceae bacterium]